MHAGLSVPRQLRKLCSPLGYHSGACALQWRRLARQRGLTAVLCYHRVLASRQRRKAGMTVDEGITSATFEAQIRFMLRHFEPVTPSQALQPGAGRPRFAVTFDDGYADNFLVAAPILRRLGVPAAFYVVSGYVGSHRRFWWDRLAALLREAPAGRLPFDGLLPGADLPAHLPLTTEAERRDATERLGAAMRQRPTTELPAVLDRLAARLQVQERPAEGDALMDWAQLRTLAGQGFEIGAHSADHLNLAQVDAQELERQVAGAKQCIERETGQPVATFAYPYGGPDHCNEAVRAAVRRAGYQGAYTAIDGVITGQQEPTALPRVALNWPLGFACAHNIDNAIRAST